MSQLSTSSFFSPINVDDGVGESSSQSTIQATTRLDKQVASVSSIQLNAIELNKVTTVIDEVVASLERIIYHGKSKDIAKLKQLKCTLISVSKYVEEDALILSPIPSMHGITADELPPSKCPSGILVMKIAGLCVGGGGVNPNVEDVGYVCFLRNDGNNTIYS